MKILNLKDIQAILRDIDLVPLIEQAYVDYSQGKTVIPPVGELLFEKPPGDVHIKYGYIKGDAYYVIKIASGFYENYQFNLPSSNGLMLVFSQKTGALESILLDQGYLTDIRTAVGGAVAAKYFAPHNVQQIGVLGSGIQAKLQLQFLKEIVRCRDVMVYSRNLESMTSYKKLMEQEGFRIKLAKNSADVAAHCNLIITATPSSQPLLFAEHIQPGTHITAVGADSPQKQELDAAIFQKANMVVVDSLTQCLLRGDTAHAYKNGFIEPKQLIELGNAIAQGKARSHDDAITIVDLTGVAVQDIAIAKAVFLKSASHNQAVSNQ